MKAYNEDLAYVHDVGFGDFARSAGPGIMRLLPPPTSDAKLVVDLGCGSGIWAEQLVPAGYKVLGFDLSPAMVRIARRRAPGADFRVMSYMDAELPPCIAVTALGECFNYLFDSRNSQAALNSLLRRIYAALRPGGVLVFDIAEPGRTQGRRLYHKLGDDWAVLVEYDERPGESLLSRSITTFRKVGSGYRRSHEVHVQRLYRVGDIVRQLREIGFSVRVMRVYGEYRLAPSVASFVARKHARRPKRLATGI